MTFGFQVTQSGHVVVDRVSRTSVSGIYAAGDVTGVFQLASVGTAVAFLMALVAGPASVGLLIPVVFLLLAGDLLWRVLAWIAIARIGACKEDLVTSLFAGLRQLARRPTAHLLTFYGTNLALSIGGGGTAYFSMPSIIPWIRVAITR